MLERVMLPGPPHSTSPAELKEMVEAERRGVPFLAYRDADGAQHLFELDASVERLTVGRSGGNDVVLEWDPEVSRLHAELERLAGRWTVSDDQLSSNGTFVGGVRVGGRRQLRDGDVLRVGRTSLLFRAPDRGESLATLAGEDSRATARLSDSQRRVLVALCRPFKGATGFANPASNKAIAAELHLTVDAVKTHMRALFRRLEVEDLSANHKRRRLVELAFLLGLVTERDL
jgi:pSer/pThr/pTyr-binding forkhead associated (FHA) protein